MSKTAGFADGSFYIKGAEGEENEKISFEEFIRKTTVFESSDPKKEFSDADKKEILDAMIDAYNVSAQNAAAANKSPGVAQKMFEDWFAENDKITFSFEADNSHVITPGRGEVNIDLAYAKRGRYLDNNGNVVEHTVQSIVIHELGHALEGLSDNSSFMTPKVTDGSQVRPVQGELCEDATYINKIFQELGIPQLNSYWAQDFNKNEADRILDKDGSYTNGVEIHRSIVIKNSYMPVDWDSSKSEEYKDKANDLLIGDGRAIDPASTNQCIYSK